MDHEDWDLSAIVRSCKTANNNNNEEMPTNSNTGLLFPQETTSGVTMPSLATLIVNQQENGQFSSFPNLMQSRTTHGFQELHQLFVNFNPTTTATTRTSTSGHGINPNSPPFPDFTARSIEHHHHHHHSPLLVPTTNYTSIVASTSGSFNRFEQQQQHQPQQPQPQPEEQKQHKNQPQVQVPQTSSSTALLQNTQSSQTPRSRKRKSLQKKMVCHVTADNLSADLWAWRKYGQKPIKGSPYPRNYYRCSSCKGCAARKQVERSLTHPGMFVITYTGEHRHAKPVHRNSLAGSTRNKTTQPVIPTTRPDPNPETPLPAAPSHHAPMMNHQGGPNDGAEGYSNIDAEDSWTKGDPLLMEQELESSEDEEDDDDVLIPNDDTAALSDAVFLDPITFDGEGKNNDNTSPG